MVRVGVAADFVDLLRARGQHGLEFRLIGHVPREQPPSVHQPRHPLAQRPRLLVGERLLHDLTLVHEGAAVGVDRHEQARVRDLIEQCRVLLHGAVVRVVLLHRGVGRVRRMLGEAVAEPAEGQEGLAVVQEDVVLVYAPLVPTRGRGQLAKLRLRHMLNRAGGIHQLHHHLVVADRQIGRGDRDGGLFRGRNRLRGDHLRPERRIALSRPEDARGEALPGKLLLSERRAHDHLHRVNLLRGVDAVAVARAGHLDRERRVLNAGRDRAHVEDARGIAAVHQAQPQHLPALLGHRHRECHLAALAVVEAEVHRRAGADALAGHKLRDELQQPHPPGLVGDVGLRAVDDLPVVHARGALEGIAHSPDEAAETRVRQLELRVVGGLMEAAGRGCEARQLRLPGLALACEVDRPRAAGGLGQLKLHQGHRDLRGPEVVAAAHRRLPAAIPLHRPHVAPLAHLGVVERPDRVERQVVVLGASGGRRNHDLDAVVAVDLAIALSNDRPELIHAGLVAPDGDVEVRVIERDREMRLRLRAPLDLTEHGEAALPRRLLPERIVERAVKRRGSVRLHRGQHRLGRCSRDNENQQKRHSPDSHDLPPGPLVRVR